MSSSIEVQRICEFCTNQFTARTTVTRFCSNRCASLARKQRIRIAKVEQAHNATLKIKNQPLEEIKAKEFLTVREVSHLLNCSIRSTYYYIESGTIKAVNLGQRITRIKRSEIDKLFHSNNQPQRNEVEPAQYDIKDCYTLTEVQEKYGISDKALNNLLSRNNIPKVKKGWFAYVPKVEIDALLS